MPKKTRSKQFWYYCNVTLCMILSGLLLCDIFSCVLLYSIKWFLLFCCIQGRNEISWRPVQEPILPPHVQTWVFSEANLLYWRKHVWYGEDFSAPPAVMWRPHNDSMPGELCPPCPHLVTPLAIWPQPASWVAVRAID